MEKIESEVSMKLFTDLEEASGIPKEVLQELYNEIQEDFTEEELYPELYPNKPKKLEDEALLMSQVFFDAIEEHRGKVITLDEYRREYGGLYSDETYEIIYNDMVYIF